MDWPYKRDVAMSFFEANKIVAALLTIGVVVLSGNFLAELLVEGEEPEVHAYQIAVLGEAEEPAETGQANVTAPQETLASLLASADPAAGEKVAKKCKACHTFKDGGANRVGPNLYGVLGQNIASHEAFTYSDALQAKSGETWSYDSLDAFLMSPKTWAPGTKMTFAGVKKPKDRAALLAYLRQMNADPPPMPE